ncbi:histidine kinase [Cytophagaceae bacterium SJW1-29]|uniref:Histidine kinase n=2 Tax=Salmonirosea aquatica TaxID=2654236 RepID=A0A7C9FRX8_9BACT|nr:histidine kinase [Cytophagaceae bacterium SJW1-29]
MPVIYPIGGYIFMGERFFTDAPTFAIGMATGIVLHWMSVFSYTWVVKRVIRQFPGEHQATQRLLVMFLGVSLLMIATAYFDLWVFSVIPGTGVSFSPQILQALLLFGIVFSIVLCIILGLFHSYGQWQERQTENEQLKRQALQQQYDALKSQINPHFLFNSLSSISGLIGDHPDLAERFVDDLAKVYRYMLQTGARTLVPLSEELTFLDTYAGLLRVRYGSCLRIELPEVRENLTGQVPPLSLQVLVDNALKYNKMSVESPLMIRLELVGDAAVRVTNVLQRKVRVVDTTQPGLTSLTAQYEQFNHAPIRVEEVDGTFSVTLPLLQSASPSIA